MVDGSSDVDQETAFGAIQDSCELAHKKKNMGVSPEPESQLLEEGSKYITSAIEDWEGNTMAQVGNVVECPFRNQMFIVHHPADGRKGADEVHKTIPGQELMAGGSAVEARDQRVSKELAHEDLKNIKLVLGSSNVCSHSDGVRNSLSTSFDPIVKVDTTPKSFVDGSPRDPSPPDHNGYLDHLLRGQATARHIYI